MYKKYALNTEHHCFSSVFVIYVSGICAFIIVYGYGKHCIFEDSLVFHPITHNININIYYHITWLD